MNLNFIKTIGYKAMLKLKNASPELALIGGIGCGIACVVTACMATRKVDPIINEVHEELDAIEAAMDREDMTPAEVKQCKKDVAKIYISAGWDIVKMYAPSAILGMASVGLTCTSHGILKNRYLNTAAAYKALDKAFKAYRKHVAEDLGYGEGEKAIAAQAKDEKNIDILNEDGTISKKDGHNLVMNKAKSPYEFDFNRFTAPLTWESDPVHNEAFLRAEQNYFNDIFRVRKHVFLNEVLDRLGLERTSAGQMVGWYWGAGDDYIDFGYLDGFIRDYNSDTDLCKKNIRLNFNCDGVIYDMLSKQV